MSRDFSQLSQSFADDATAPPPSSEMNLDIKRLLYVRAPLMIAIAIIVGIPAVLAAWFLTPIKYEATAILQFRAVTPRVIYTNQGKVQETPYDKFNTDILRVPPSISTTKTSFLPANILG